MALISTPELAAIRATVDAILPDLCQISALTASATSSGTGYLVHTYATWSTGTSDAIACLVEEKTVREITDGTQTAAFDTEITIPIRTTVAATDKVRVIQRMGETVTPREYFVVGEPIREVAFQVLRCRSVGGMPGVG